VLHQTIPHTCRTNNIVNTQEPERSGVSASPQDTDEVRNLSVGHQGYHLSENQNHPVIRRKMQQEALLRFAGPVEVICDEGGRSAS
jgi:hypothetical protein